MAKKLRLINDEDMIKYLQENQALLKTLLWRMEQATPNSAQAQQESVVKYREFLGADQAIFEGSRILPE